MDDTYPRPIPAYERLPVNDEAVLFFHDGEWEIGELVDGKLDGNTWWQPHHHFDILEVSDSMFWMPLPPAPKPE